MRKLSRWKKAGLIIRTAGTLALAGVMFAGAPAVWAAPTSGAAVSDNIVVREEAVSGAQIGSLYANQEVTITGETEGSDGNVWYQITFEGTDGERTGWVRSDLIGASDSSAAGEEGDASSDVQGTAENQEDDADAGNTVRFETNGGYVDLRDVPEEEAALVSDRFVPAECGLDGGSVQGYQLAGPDAMVAADADLTVFYYLYGTNELGEQGWYVYDSEKNVLQKNLVNMSYSIPEQTEPEGDQTQQFDVNSIYRMLAAGLCLICVLLLVLVVVFSVRYRKLRNLLEDAADDREEISGNGKSEKRDAAGAEKTEKKAAPRKEEHRKAEAQNEDYDIPVSGTDGYDLPDDDSYDVYDLDDLDEVLEAEKEPDIPKEAEPKKSESKSKQKQEEPENRLQEADRELSGEDAELERILREESGKMFGTENEPGKDAAEKPSEGKKTGEEEQVSAKADPEQKKDPYPDLPEDIEFVDDGVEDEDLEFL